MSEPTHGADALSCRVAVSFAEGASELLASLNVALSPYPASGERVFSVLVNKSAARVTHVAQDETPIWTLVRHDTGAGALWDHGTRRVFEVTADETGPTPVAAAAGVEVAVDSRDGAARADILLQDAASGTFTLELDFDGSGDLRRHGPALLWLLYGGPACHKSSGWPLRRLEKLGCLTAARVHRLPDEAPLCSVAISEHRIVTVDPKDFEPPGDFDRAGEQPQGTSPEHSPATSHYELDASPFLGETGRMALAAVRRDALEARRDQFTPDCLGASSRFGSIAAFVHQDVLTHAQTLINAAAPFLGTAMIGGTTVTIDWLAALQAIRGTTAAGAMAPGSGLFCLLRDPRRAATSTSPASGGTGLLDKLAVANLTDHEPGEPSYLEREAMSGALAETMRNRWGVTTTALVSDILAARGDLTKLNTAERIAIAEAYETSELGRLRFDVPVSEEFEIPGLASGSLLSMSGTMSFGGLGGAPLVPTATIGSTGNITIGVTLPPTAVTATVEWQLAPEVSTAGTVIAVVGCILSPFLCPGAAIVGAALASTVNVQVVTASTTGATITLDVSYDWDQGRGVVGPTVNVLSTTGTVNVGVTTASSPPSLAAIFVQLLDFYGQWMNAWIVLLATALADAVEGALRGQGLELPAASEPDLSAVDGRAISVAGSHLLLRAELTTDPATGSQPYATQVPNAESIAQQLEACQTVMRAATTPAPPTPAPVALYVGLAPSQNALNHYVGARWRGGVFRADYWLGPALTHLLALAPPGAFPAAVVAVHAWPASCPRIEIAEAALAAQDLPLVAFFDDLRICFEGVPRHSGDRVETAFFELSLNVKTPAAVTMAGPFIPEVLFDAQPASIEISDVRVGELVDPNQPVKAARIDLHLWEPLALEVVRVMLEQHSAGALTAPPPPIAWPAPIPLGPAHELVHIAPVAGLTPQAFYLELLGRRRAVYMLPVVRTTLLELIDGSPAPMLNKLLATTGVSLSSMTCPQGTTLRGDFSAVLSDFVIPP